MKKRILLIVCLNIVLAMLFSFASCSEKAPGQTDGGAGTADTDITTQDPGTSDPKTDEESKTPADTSSPTENEPIDYGEKKITEENGKKILTCGYLKITASHDKVTGETSGQADYIKPNMALNYSFKVNREGRIYGNLPMDYYAYVEEMFDIVITSAIFESSEAFEEALGKKTNNLQRINIYQGLDPKYKVADDGGVFLYNSTTLVYFPAGITGEYVVPDGTTRIMSGAFAGSKLSRVVLPLSVNSYEDSFAGVNFTVDFGSEKLVETKTLSEGNFKITTKKYSTEEEIDVIAYISDHRGKRYYYFVIEGENYSGNIPMDYYSYIEKMLGIVIDTVTFDDERMMEEALGTKGNNVLNVYVNPTGLKNYSIEDGVVFSKSSTNKTLVYFPAGRTGEYTVPDGTVAIAPEAFTGTKLGKLILPSSVVSYEDAVKNIPTLTVEKKS